MTAQSFQTNTFTSGMDLDTDVTMLANNKYRYAENVRLVTNDGGTTGVLQNIEGVKRYSSYIPIDETILGTATIHEIGIVITKTKDNKNKVYRITDFNSNAPTITVILKGDIGLCEDIDKTPNVSIVGNYETDANIKIYFTDGNSQIKVLNIVDGKYTKGSHLVDSNGNILSPLAIDITPGAELTPFEVTDVQTGNLPVCSIQYCYQLFNLHGSETTISPLSNVVHLTNSSTAESSQDYYGGFLGDSSGKSCVLNTTLQNKDFDKCRIISIFYLDPESTPIINIVNEIDLTTNQTEINYVDSGNSYMGEMTIDEFNMLSGYQFKAKTIEKKDNRLFAANITEDTWNPEYYDARAYRCNASGSTILESASGNNLYIDNIDTYDLSSIPSDHDCINSYNTADLSSLASSSQYKYGNLVNGKRILGGHGINIDYNFVTVPLHLVSNRSSNGTIQNNVGMNIEPMNFNSVIATNVGMSTSETILFPSSLSQRLPNYADPYIASRFKGYMRDEVYRFGIMFYNNKNIPSPVYWIADIRMPHANDDGFATFENTGVYLDAKALGIHFTVKNMPAGAIGYEIVRCDRTDSDKTIVTQGVLSQIGNYTVNELDGQVGTGNVIDTSIEYRPFPYLTWSQGNSVIRSVSLDSDNSQGTLNLAQKNREYFRFVSPEVCVNGESFEDMFNDSVTINVIASATSNIDKSDLSNGKVRLFAMSNKALQIDGNEEDFGDLIQLSYTSLEDSDIVTSIPLKAFYSAFISKYYSLNYDSDNVVSPASIEYAKYPSIIPYNAFSSGVTAYRINVGDIMYTNYAMSSFNKTGWENQPVLGPAGPCMIIKSSQLNDIFPFFNGNPLGAIYATNALPVVNIKRNTTTQYGGNTYAARQNSVYISTFSYKQETSSGNSYVFGGDTYLNVLDYPITMTYQANDTEMWKEYSRFFGAYIPFESSINMNLFSGDMAHRTYRSGDNYIDSHMQIDITQKQLYHVQDRPYYVYNKAYSTQSGSKKYVPQSIYAEDDLSITNRIVTSQAKTNNEVLDNWTQFKVADYLDVDNQYGDVTNLKSFNNRLFYWQNTAVGVAAVNERALINDGNVGQLTLGTGGVLDRYDYITTTNGSSIVNDRSIVTSDSILYWYDYDKNEICAYNGQVNSISKEKQVQSYLNELYADKRNVTLSLFDKKYNEVWFKFYNKSLVFNEQLGVFTSFYTFNPEWALSFSDKIVAIKSNNLYLINTLDIDGLDDVDKKAKLQIVINKDGLYTKVYDNIFLSGEFKDENNKLLTSDIIDYMKFGTKHQTATLDSNVVMDYREDTYRMAVPRQDESEQDTSMSYPARLKGKYLTCEYWFDSGIDHTFRIPQITTTYRYSLV